MRKYRPYVPDDVPSNNISIRVQNEPMDISLPERVGKYAKPLSRLQPDICINAINEQGTVTLIQATMRCYSFKILNSNRSLYSETNLSSTVSNCRTSETRSRSWDRCIANSCWSHLSCQGSRVLRVMTPDDNPKSKCLQWVRHMVKTFMKSSRRITPTRNCSSTLKKGRGISFWRQKGPTDPQ